MDKGLNLLDLDENIRYDWHSHTRNQLMYSFAGTMTLETANAYFLLPPQRAAWIPAGIMHRTTLNNVRSGSVYLDISLVDTDVTSVRIISVAPIVREMVRYALRWPPFRNSNDQLANAFFRAFGLMCMEWIKEEIPFCLPMARTVQLAKAIEYTLGNLESAKIEKAAYEAALSQRQFRRRFMSETGITWQQFLQQARMLKAMELLSIPQANITTTAFVVGFNSLSSFAKSFKLFTGQAPREFRRVNEIGGV